MKRFLCVLISAALICGLFTVMPASVSAKKAKPVSLKKASATLEITKDNNKTSYGSTKIKLKKVKGVKIKKKTFKSSDKSIAKVSKKGKITAVSKGKTTVTVKVKYTYKKKKYTKNLKFMVKVKNASAFIKKLTKFSNRLYSMSSKGNNKNFSMSPISVYMALSMLYYTADNNVKNEIKELCGMNDSDFAETGKLFNMLNKEYKTFEGKTAAQLKLTNSIWFDKSEKFNTEEMSKLEKELYCNAFGTTFKDNNKAANKEIQEFIKKQTNGLIDQDFNLKPETILALINTLYFKDIWQKGIDLSTEKREFKTADSTKKIDFLIGNYCEGRVQETDTAKYFFTVTEHGYKIKFVLPKDGCSLSKAMAPESLNKINNRTDYKFKEGNTEHYTRCIFPSFKIESETPLTKIFQENNYLQTAFYKFDSPLTKDPLCVSEIKHNTVIDVNKKGVEGAAVTIITLDKASAMIGPVKKVYHDFVLDKNFGFIITDPSGVTLFEGQVYNP